MNVSWEITSDWPNGYFIRHYFPNHAFTMAKEVIINLAFTLAGAIGVAQIIICHDSSGVRFD